MTKQFDIWGGGLQIAIIHFPSTFLIPTYPENKNVIFAVFRSLGVTSGESLTKYVHGDLNNAATQVKIDSDIFCTVFCYKLNLFFAWNKRQSLQHHCFLLWFTLNKQDIKGHSLHYQLKA